MPSLGEAYDDARWGDRSPRQVHAGIAVFLAGALAVVVAIALVTTPLADVFGLNSVATYRVAGVIAGVGVPGTFLGVVAVLPSSRRQRLGVVLGTAVAVGGVALFWYAYPAHWTATDSSLAFPTAAVYFLGGALALWFVFATLANSHVRNDPHGTVRLRLTRQGESRVVEVSRDDYRRYAAAISDGGEDERVIREIESKYE
ncbi:hypothetical protein HLRTI_000248 [Halorhabdus tiamatea SARL4B]|uniref:Conserved hypothetical membrane protein n=1 Tax=Halorhabdus tiamatea SARL4B TaxID=1033806 RepID=F7PJZ6_9EURY|nr:hypothetical protein [Halorhabdus tiamatea]ERJ07525.1 hypothetical protein HLRTI_000248 [Halorhabdus tiamatea SARL4B]CCQ33527.1 conserved hypothetical membrane protein [Halorhabdus tiamatea SARL4B]